MQLRVLRLALVSGVLVFGAVVWFLRRSGGAPEPSVDPAALLIAGRLVWGVAVVGCSVLYLHLRRVTSAVQYRSGSIIAWALGEATAIYGGVVFLLAGTAFWYQLGVGFMVLAVLAFPGEPPR